MSTAAGTRSTSYELRVAGHVDDHWSAELCDLTLSRRPDGTTVLSGPIADQAQLHGVLARIRDLGITLLSLSTLDTANPPALSQPLRTERLTLRAATAGDADTTWRYRRLESVGQWLSEIPADLPAYRTRFTDPPRLAATVIVELGDDLVGDFMLRVEDPWAQAEIAEQARGTQAELGWVLDPAYTGQGLAAEAVRELLRHCFADLGLRRVVANCFLDNETSWRLMERAGMRREAHAVGESLHRSGQWLDSVRYAVLATEWLD